MVYRIVVAKFVRQSLRVGIVHGYRGLLEEIAGMHLMIFSVHAYIHNWFTGFSIDA